MVKKYVRALLLAYFINNQMFNNCHDYNEVIMEVIKEEVTKSNKELNQTKVIYKLKCGKGQDVKMRL